MNEDSKILIPGIIGRCGHRKVFMGFATAGLLCRASYADVLEESTGRGYQRRMSRDHSLEFKRYIQLPDATSIPLTFNLRESSVARWTLSGEDAALLELNISEGPVLTQVDGQHRLGFLQDSPIQFAFMTFLGLTDLEEMEVFRTINGKAKGLSSSLLDFTEAKSLGDDLSIVDPALFIAIRLNTETSSPWQGKLDLGGERTVGTKRIASLRTMHHATDRFLKEARYHESMRAKEMCAHVIAFWRAVTITLPREWADPRRHVLCKGIGVYALMSLAGYLIREAEQKNISLDFFVSKLSDFADRLDWSNHGPLEGFGGAKGADMAFKLILDTRKEMLEKVCRYA